MDEIETKQLAVLMRKVEKAWVKLHSLRSEFTRAWNNANVDSRVEAWKLVGMAGSGLITARDAFDGLGS